MNNLVTWFTSEESGQGMVEYGLIVALIGVAITGALTAMSGGLNDIFSKITGSLASV